ncbi:hypothetical protein D9M72_486190 [compost metagenome]
MLLPPRAFEWGIRRETQGGQTAEVARKVNPGLNVSVHLTVALQIVHPHHAPGIGISEPRHQPGVVLGYLPQPHKERGRARLCIAFHAAGWPISARRKSKRSPREPERSRRELIRIVNHDLLVRQIFQVRFHQRLKPLCRPCPGDCGFCGVAQASVA